MTSKYFLNPNLNLSLNLSLNSALTLTFCFLRLNFILNLSGSKTQNMVYNSFEDMPVWKKAMELATEIFKFTEKLPRKEDYGLTSQIRNSALSIAGNLAEGFGRKHTRDKLNFYYHSRGSLAETKSHLIYGFKVGYFNDEEFGRLSDLINDVWKELNSLINSLSKKL